MVRHNKVNITVESLKNICLNFLKPIQPFLKLKRLMNNSTIIYKNSCTFVILKLIHKKMKKTINFIGKCLFIMVLFVSNIAFAQNTNVIPDARLYQCYEKAYLDNLVKTNPEQIQYLNYYLDNAYYVASLKAEKPVTGIDINTLFEKSKKGVVTKISFKEKVYNKTTFNVLKYNFQTGYLDTPTYIWKEAGIAIVFRPEKYIKEDFQMLQKSKK